MGNFINKEFEIVPINWGNHKLVAKDTHSNTINLNELEEYPNCLYQVYGNSIIYGENKLLYIGQTNAFKRRLIEHIETDFNRILNLSFIIGRFEDENCNSKEILKLIENILICYVKPAYNSTNIKDIHPLSKEKSILILNKGYRGSLPLECSNYWWPKKE